MRVPGSATDLLGGLQFASTDAIAVSLGRIDRGHVVHVPNFVLVPCISDTRPVGHGCVRITPNVTSADTNGMPEMTIQSESGASHGDLVAAADPVVSINMLGG
jgi:hypothetical protein